MDKWNCREGPDRRTGVMEVRCGAKIWRKTELERTWGGERPEGGELGLQTWRWLMYQMWAYHTERLPRLFQLRSLNIPMMGYLGVFTPVYIFPSSGFIKELLELSSIFQTEKHRVRIITKPAHITLCTRNSHTSNTSVPYNCPLTCWWPYRAVHWRRVWTVSHPLLFNAPLIVLALTDCSGNVC